MSFLRGVFGRSPDEVKSGATSKRRQELIAAIVAEQEARLRVVDERINAHRGR